MKTCSTGHQLSGKSPTSLTAFLLKRAKNCKVSKTIEGPGKLTAPRIVEVDEEGGFEVSI